MKSTISKLLRNFEISLAEETLNSPLLLAAELILISKNPLYFHIQQRSYVWGQSFLMELNWVIRFSCCRSINFEMKKWETVIFDFILNFALRTTLKLKLFEFRSLISSKILLVYRSVRLSCPSARWIFLHVACESAWPSPLSASLAVRNIFWAMILKTDFVAIISLER